MLDIKRREFIALVGAGGLLLAVKVKRAWGQQRPMPVIGFLHVGSAGALSHLVVAFRQGLKETGYVEGTNVMVEISLGRGTIRSVARVGRRPRPPRGGRRCHGRG